MAHCFAVCPQILWASLLFCAVFFSVRVLSFRYSRVSKPVVRCGVGWGLGVGGSVEWSGAVCVSVSECVSCVCK